MVFCIRKNSLVWKIALPEMHGFTLRSVDTLLPSKESLFLSLSLQTFFVFFFERVRCFLSVPFRMSVMNLLKAYFRRRKNRVTSGKPLWLEVIEAINTLEPTVKLFLSRRSGRNLYKMFELKLNLYSSVTSELLDLHTDDKMQSRCPSRVDCFVSFRLLGDFPDG